MSIVDGNWLEKLKEWHPIGEKELSKSYIVVRGTFGKFNNPVSSVEKKLKNRMSIQPKIGSN